MAATIALKIGNRVVLTGQARGRYVPAIVPADPTAPVTVLPRTSSLKTLRTTIRRNVGPEAVEAHDDVPTAYGITTDDVAGSPDHGTLRVVDSFTGQPVNLAAVLRGTTTGPRLQRHA